MSRTKNSLLNITASIGGQLLTNVLRWICRMVFIYTLGKEYLGISSLYANILTILSLSELGLGSAITYSLYKPLAENDTEAVKSLMAFFKKAYRWIGIAGTWSGVMPDAFFAASDDRINRSYQYLSVLFSVFGTDRGFLSVFCL